ncbi:MAG: valine--tRNA ligase [Ignavibacteria bacterium]|nr:valine--tRNA ligase [Ignavibacteria bacterium]
MKSKVKVKEIEKNYNFEDSEKKWQEFWEKNKVYESHPNPKKKKYSVVIPPPNVTGILHFGHMFNNTIQDIYCRWKRMQGFEVCWVPGMDHAGIATQVMVEKELAKEGKTKYDLGREKFVNLVWDWKEKNGGIILKQLRKLGASVDWSKERFTLDEGLSLNVKKVFVDLYKKGLIYRGNRIVNWDPESQTAVSDDEIFYEERKEKLYYIKYKIVDSDEYVTIATTRPETMFGDTGVAVNPEDTRYKHLINKEVNLPLVNKKIPIVFDTYVDKEFGTGALKITPAHDINDFEIGQRHNLNAVTVLNKDSTLNELTGEFSGMEIHKARKAIVKKLEENGLIEKIEDYTHNVAFSDRTKAVIEPYLSEQWFVSMKKLAEPAIEVVRNGDIRFYPERYIKVYFHWMENIRDWCISRQLWWGHQIPIWYHNDTGGIYCEINPPQDIENWTQDEDVLDTWFSSWLWPLSVFGWSNDKSDNDNKNLQYYYPTDFLSTGPEIIFLWVARMIMAGLEYTGKIPFSDVYFHSTIRDGKGVKMSKTLGNYSDAIELMEKYGTDALRFTIIYIAPLGNDVLFEEEKTQIGRNFITKLWNAGRFLLMTKEKFSENISGTNESLNYRDDLIDVWMESRFNSTLQNAEKYLKEYRINEYSKTLYNFVWSDFCDWYIELMKIKLNENPKNGDIIINKALFYFESILKILHPVIPYVTEELWHILEDGRDDKSISKEIISEYNTARINKEFEKKFEEVKEIVISIRNLKATNGIPSSKKLTAFIMPGDENASALLSEFNTYILKLCNLEEIKTELDKNEVINYLNSVVNKFEICLPAEDVKNLSSNNEKVKKELENIESYLSGLNKKLTNENFLAKASESVINAERKKQEEAEIKLNKLKKLIK